MATQAKEANPYNANKDWHNKKDKPFVSADGAFFEEPQPQVETSEEPKQSKKETKNKPDYKKRYDDLKSHYDSKLNEFKSREQELLEQATKNMPEYKAPKSPEELEKFREQYPDVYEVVETVAHMQSSERTKTLEERLAALQERETELVTNKQTIGCYRTILILKNLKTAMSFIVGQKHNHNLFKIGYIKTLVMEILQVAL